MGEEGEILWYCCRCHQFWLYALCNACIDCNHQCCESCRKEKDGKPLRVTVSRVGKGIRPVLQTQCQDAARSVTTNVADSDFRKVREAKPLSGRVDSLDNACSPKRASTKPAQRNMPLTRPTYQGEEPSIAHKQLQPTGQIPSKLPEQKVDRILDANASRSTPVHLLSPANVATLELAVASPLFSERFPDPLEQWLETIARAGIQDSSFPGSVTPVLISDPWTTQCCQAGGVTNSCSMHAICPVTLEMHTDSKRAPTPETTKTLFHEHDRIQGPQEDLMSPEFHSHGSAYATTKKGGLVVDKTGACQPNGNERPLPLAGVRSPQVDLLVLADDGLFNLLTQILYSALYFDPSGSFRKCGNDQAPLHLPTSTTSGQTPTTPRKRRLEGGGTQQGEDESRKSGKTKRSRPRSGTPVQAQRRFACLHCKCDLSYGDELMCAGWSSESIDTVLRRHLERHIQYGHISQTTYDRVRALMRGRSLTDPQQAEELWVEAYMEVFDIQDRRRVPSPYYDCTNLASNPNVATLAGHLMRRLSEDPATAIPLRTYITANAALNRDRNVARERVRIRFRIEEDQLIAGSRAQREVAIRELDTEYDARQLRLDTELESALESGHRPESENHTMPQEGVGTVPSTPSVLSHMSGSMSTHPRRISSSGLLSDESLGFPSSSSLAVSTLFQSNPIPGNARRPATDDVLPEDIIPIEPLSPDGIESEAFVGIPTRQSLPSTRETDSRHSLVPADAVHTHANGTTEGAESVSTSVDLASNVSNSQYDLLPDSGYASSYAECGYCGRLCYVGQDICDACTDLLYNRPYL